MIRTVCGWQKHSKIMILNEKNIIFTCHNLTRMHRDLEAEPSLNQSQSKTELKLLIWSRQMAIWTLNITTWKSKIEILMKFILFDLIFSRLNFETSESPYKLQFFQIWHQNDCQMLSSVLRMSHNAILIDTFWLDRTVFYLYWPKVNNRIILFWFSRTVFFNLKIELVSTIELSRVQGWMSYSAAPDRR